MAAQLQKLMKARRDGDALAAGFGSDVYERYSARYSWQSNQVAHAGMGMLGASVLIVDAILLLGPGLSVLVGFAFIAVPFFKDVTDFCIDRSRRHPAFEATEQERHNAKRELFLDWIADEFHWTAGAALAVGLALLAMPGTLISPDVRWGYWAIALACIAAGAREAHGFYGLEKQAIDDAGLLYYSRLARFTGNIDKEHADIVKAFVAGGPGAPAHVVIGGERGTGRTELALAIAAELAVRRRRARYITLDALLDALGGTDWPASKDPDQPWPPMHAEYLVVDDLEDNPVVAHSMQMVLGEVMTVAMALPAFTCRRFVWVTGDDAALADWHQWIEKTFPPPQYVWTVFIKKRSRHHHKVPYFFLRHLTSNLPIMLGFVSVALWLAGPHRALWVPVALGAAAVAILGCRSISIPWIKLETRLSLKPALCIHAIGLVAAIVLARIYP